MNTSQQDTCEKHNTPAKKTYSFGNCDDAEVTVFSGCNCAACFSNNGFNDDGELFPSYTAAAGQARLFVAQASTW